jgi:nickel transport protein
MGKRRTSSAAARRAACCAAVAACLLAAAEARAHKLALFAAAEGDLIAGRAYFVGGGRAAGVTVRVLGPGGRKLGQTVTDADGRFTFKAQAACDHTFVVETADGHAARWTVPAAEIALPAPASQPAGGAPSTRPAPAGREELKRMIDEAVARHVNRLREELASRESRVRLHEVLGGIGYIVGAAGLLLLLRSRRRRLRSPEST